jgi:hypothetical protein
MREFKFFQKGTVDMLDGETHITASFNDDTPEGHMGRRRLYHTNLPEYERQRMETNRYFESPTYGSHMETMRLGTPERHRDIIRRINEQRDLNETEQYLTFFSPITVTKVNPKWWMKVKMFGTGVKLVLKSTWLSDPIGIVVVSTLLTLVTIIGIAKLLGA